MMRQRNSFCRVAIAALMTSLLQVPAAQAGDNAWNKVDKTLKAPQQAQRTGGRKVTFGKAKLQSQTPAAQKIGTAATRKRPNQQVHNGSPRKFPKSKSPTVQGQKTPAAKRVHGRKAHSTAKASTTRGTTTPRKAKTRTSSAPKVARTSRSHGSKPMKKVKKVKVSRSTGKPAKALAKAKSYPPAKAATKWGKKIPIAGAAIGVAFAGAAIAEQEQRDPGKTMRDLEGIFTGKQAVSGEAKDTLASFGGVFTQVGYAAVDERARNNTLSDIKAAKRDVGGFLKKQGKGIDDWTKKAGNDIRTGKVAKSAAKAGATVKKEADKFINTVGSLFK